MQTWVRPSDQLCLPISHSVQPILVCNISIKEILTLCILQLEQAQNCIILTANFQSTYQMRLHSTVVFMVFGFMAFICMPFTESFSEDVKLSCLLTDTFMLFQQQILIHHLILPVHVRLMPRKSCHTKYSKFREALKTPFKWPMECCSKASQGTYQTIEIVEVKIMNGNGPRVISWWLNLPRKTLLFANSTNNLTQPKVL